MHVLRLQRKRILFFLLRLNEFYEGYLSGPQFLLDNKWLPHDAFINVLDIIRRSLKMASRVITLGNVAMILGPVFGRNK
jgi:hypothetical protein